MYAPTASPVSRTPAGSMTSRAMHRSAGTSSDAGIGTVTPEEPEQGLELFRVAVLGAGPGRFPALAHFARDVHPLSADRRTAFEDIVDAHLDHIESAVARG